ncbi:MAG: ABC transporter ATP-binding protein [Crocinitomicaceae bacterium]|nr:ABC transporter ATP-binding protein [Crocinitomicaceae bacterium]
MLLELKDITVSAGNQKLFDLDKIALDKGVVSLVGRNGSGKSTFLRTLLGEHKNYTGKILFNGKALNSYSVSERSKLISVVFSKAELFGSHSVKEVLLLGRLPHMNMFSVPSKEDEQMALKTAEVMRIVHLIDKSFAILSDGEKQLVMIGRALMQNTPLVLMDEPAAYLDIVNRYELSLLLKRIADETGKLIICSTHQMERLGLDSDHMLIIADQKMKLFSDKNEFIKVVHQSFGIV